MNPSQTPATPHAWLVLCGLLAAGSSLIWWMPNANALAWSAADWKHAPWTLWTAPLVHLSGAHLVGNLLALAALVVLGVALPLGPRATLALLLAWPLSTASLLAWPEVTRYAGLSGVVHAGVAIAWLHTRHSPGAQHWAPLLIFPLLFKLATEQAWLQPIVFDPRWGLNVVTAAHLGGALWGGLLGALLLIRPSSR